MVLYQCPVLASVVVAEEEEAREVDRLYEGVVPIVLPRIRLQLRRRSLLLVKRSQRCPLDLLLKEVAVEAGAELQVQVAVEAVQEDVELEHQLPLLRILLDEALHWSSRRLFLRHAPLYA
jgi:hypothetical protein